MNAATQGTTTMLEAIDAERTIKDLQGRIDAALVVLDSGDWPPDVVVSVGRILRGEPAGDGCGEDAVATVIHALDDKFAEPKFREEFERQHDAIEDVEPTLGSQTGPAPSGGSE